MSLDLSDIEEHIAKCKADLEFWEKAKAVFSDPRIAGGNGAAAVAPRPYGELKRTVEAALGGPNSAGATPQEIVGYMTSRGFVFNTKIPSIAVNEALRSLSKEGKAKIVGTRGTSNLWNRGQEETPA